ncbi:hypothetical protein AB0E69_27050 [Kribbella sp. NPDC026611]|uniref:hypothetical protein n=1 Tax=Kribbella sp. NPDC026611 TaxID=3154911 RepID=UPI0033F05346
MTLITAASFPTPHIIKTSNNPAVWDQQERFAALQASAATEALEWLGGELGGAGSVRERAIHFLRLHRQLADWRYQLAQREEGRSPESLLRQYGRPIGDVPIVDMFGRGLRSVGFRIDAERGVIVPGAETPASRQHDRLAGLIEARFDAEAPDFVKLQNWVLTRSGRQIAGNQILRGLTAGVALGIFAKVEGLYCTRTADADDRRALQWEGFETLAELETDRANGRSDLIDDPDARRRFIAAEYFLYQGPEYDRGGDAVTRVLLATAHTRIFGVPPKLPQDVDVMAYVAGQEGFHRYVESTQGLVTVGTGGSVTNLEQRARDTERTTGLERG